MGVAQVVFVVREKETIHDAGSYFPFLREGLNLSLESSAHRLLSMTRWDCAEEHHEQKWQVVALFQHSVSSACAWWCAPTGSDSHPTEKQTNPISRLLVVEQAVVPHTQTVAASLLQGSKANGRGVGEVFVCTPF